MTQQLEKSVDSLYNTNTDFSTLKRETKDNTTKGGQENGVDVSSQGRYLFPNLAVKDEPQIIGKYGMLRRTYLKENRRNWYQSMLMSGRLNQHLAQIEEAAESRVETLLDSLNEKFPAPSKEQDPLAWAAHQNNLTAMAEEIVLKELVYN